MNFLIDFIINKNCNLNCKNCTSRASICEPDIYDFEQFKKDFKHLSNTIKKFESLIIGGEPFCNKDIFKYIEFIKSIDKNHEVLIFTNGLFLTKAKEEIWQKLSEFNCKLLFSLYPCEHIDYNSLKEKCKKYNVRFVATISHLRNEMQVHKYCNENTEEYKKNTTTRSCLQQDVPLEPICVRCHNGIMYLSACFPMLSNIDKKFNTQLESKLIENQDYIKIENIKTFQDIRVDKVNFCKNFCRFLGREKWGKSKKEYSEFFVED